MQTESTQSQWRAAAKLLGLNIEHAASDRAPCPFCNQGKINIYSDAILGGLYFVGDDCFPHGDLVDLAAKKLGLDRDSALHQLHNIAPSLSLTYSGQTEFRTNIEKGRGLIEAIWKAAMPLNQAIHLEPFQRILRNRAMPFEDRFSWHKRNLERQFRAIPADIVEHIVRGGTERSLQEITFAHPRCPRNMFLISRLYSLPGQLTGLQLSTTGFNNRVVEHFQTVSKNCDEAGFAIHPDNVNQTSEIVLCTNSSWCTKASFVYANHSETLNPLASIINHGKFKTASLQALRARPVVVWGGRLTPQMLSTAVRLNAQITNFGADDSGKIRRDALNQIHCQEMVGVLRRHAKPWQEKLLEFGRMASPDEMMRLLEIADLDLTTVEEIAEIVAPEAKSLFIERFFNPCPPRHATTARGNIEQRRGGWVQVKRGKEAILCNKCWRVRSITYPGFGQVIAELEVLEADKWHRIGVDFNQLCKSPWKVIGKACISLELSPFSADPAWQSRAMHIASQFHPVIETKKSQALGVDLSKGIIRTTRTQISLAEGRIAAADPVSNQLLLPLAGRELPSRKAVESIIQHRGLQRVISAMVYQLTSHIVGNDEVVVMGSGQFSSLTTQVLQATALSDHRCPFKLVQQSPGEQLSISQANTTLRSAMPLWATAGHDVANWLAGIRPTIYLGHKCVVSLPVNNHHLQRCILQLLARTLGHVQSGHTVASAVDLAWRSFAQHLGVKSSLEQLELVAPIVRVEAMGYWISKAIVTGCLAEYQRQPRKFDVDSFWYERRTHRFSINRAAIAFVLKKHGIPPWDLAELENEVLCHPHFHGSNKHGRSVVWRLGTQILTKAANAFLYGPQVNIASTPATTAAVAG